MTDDIKKILEDLYHADESLRAHEKVLVQCIEGIVASRPKVKFDEKFQAELKRQLLAKVEEIKLARATDIPTFTKLFYTRLAYSFVGVSLVAAIAFIVVADLKTGVLVSKNQSLAYAPIFGKANVVKVGDRAFGDLSAAPQSPVSSITPLGLGGGGNGATQSMVATDSKVAGTGTSERAMIWPGSIKYTYVYKGEPLTISDEKLPVYRRVKGTDAADALALYLKRVDLGLINLNALSDVKAQSFSVVEDRDYGYTLYVDAVEGAISIGENSRWNPSNQELQLLTDANMLDDQTMISMANDFLQQYGIDKSNYGAPEVDKTPQIFYAMAKSQGTEAYVPEIMTVVYPISVDGKEILDSAGNKTGLRLNINLRHKKVSSLWSLSTQNYENSDYATEKDASRIMKIVERGGFYSYPDENAEKTVQVEIGTPKLAWVSTYMYRNGQSEELLVPSYVFPIIKAPEGNPYFQTTIVVPAVKEILDQQQNNGSGAVPALMKQ